LPGMRGALQAALVLLAAGAAFLLLRRLATVLFSLFAGLTVGVALKPAVEWQHRRGVPRWLGAVAVYTALAALVAAMVLCAVPLLAEQIGTLASSAPGQLGRLRQALHGSSNRLLRELGGRVPDLGAMKLLSAPLDLGQAGRLWPLARAAGRGALTIGATLLLA